MQHINLGKDLMNRIIDDTKGCWKSRDASQNLKAGR